MKLQAELYKEFFSALALALLIVMIYPFAWAFSKLIQE